MANLNRPVHEVKLPLETVHTTLASALKQFEGCPNDPMTRRAIEHTVESWFQTLGDPVPQYALVEADGQMLVHIGPELPMDAAEYERRTGAPPENDDLDRVNCPTVGVLGHWACGWCVTHAQPEFRCMCRGQKGR